MRIVKDGAKYYLTTKLSRGGVVIDHVSIGPLRIRLHARLWRPFLLVIFGLRGRRIHGFQFGTY